MNYWEKILEGFSFKSTGGAPDFTNPNDRMLLRMELLKKGWNQNAVNELLYRLTEQEVQKVPVSGDNAKTKGGLQRYYFYDKGDNVIRARTDQYNQSKRGGNLPYATKDQVDDETIGKEDDGEQTTTTAEQDLDSLTDQRDKIFTGETTPPGTGGSAVMETIGGEYSEQLANGEYEGETEDEFVQRQMRDRGDKPPLNTLSEKDQIKWLKISFKKGKNDIESLKGNAEHDYGEQPKGFPKAASGDADTAEPVLSALEKELANAKTEEDRNHYEYQIKKFKERVRQPGEKASGEKDSDSLLIYHDSKGRLRIHHISDKSSLNDTFMNKTIETKRISHEKASESVGRDMNLSKEETEAISSSINQKEAEVGEDVKNTSMLPHKTLKDKSDDDINEGVENGIGGIMGNLGSGQRGRRDYTDKINGEIKNAKTARSAGTALKNQLDKMGAKPDENGNYSSSDIAKAILAEVRDNPNSSWRKYVDKMGTAILDTRGVATIVEREVRKKADKENPKPSEEEIQNRINQETAERMSGQGKSGRKLDSSEPAKPITAEDVAFMRQEGGMADELSDMVGQ